MRSKENALQNIQLFVLDMDGTVYLGENLIDGSLDFIHKVDADPNRDYIFFTNASTSTNPKSSPPATSVRNF